MQFQRAVSIESTGPARLIAPPPGLRSAERGDSQGSKMPSAWFEICRHPEQMLNQPLVLHGSVHISSPEHVVALPQAAKPSHVDRALRCLGRWFCLLRGHDMLPQFSSNRLFLKCTSCGEESPGWQLAGAHPVVRFRGDARRHRVETRSLTVYRAQEGARTGRISSVSNEPRRAAG